jgi:hypothetical protein
MTYSVEQLAIAAKEKGIKCTMPITYISISKDIRKARK